jgi:hypothetical protein
MATDQERWKDGPLRNTVGDTHGATGPLGGGVEGHAKTAPPDKLKPRPQEEKPDPSILTGSG